MTVPGARKEEAPSYIPTEVVAPLYDHDSKLAELQRQVKAKQQELELREGLPHLHGWPWYQWAWDFFTSTNKLNFLCAANQISKSSTQIRKCIDWATDQAKWPGLWLRKPIQFWYFYPSQKVVNAEWETKWQQFMPRGKYKDDPVYGWRLEKDKQGVVAVHFNSGVHMYFKTYAQKEAVLQAGTLDAIFCFEGHTPVLTEKGVLPIRDVVVGTMVPTKDGSVRRVDKHYSRKARTIRRLLSNGSFVDATPDHKFWVEGVGWTELQALTPRESLGKSATWAHEKIRSSRERFIRATSEQVTGVMRTFSSKAASWVSGSCTPQSGKLSVARSLLDTLFTIKMKIQETTRLVTWPVYRRLSILACTSSRNGAMGLWANQEGKFAVNAAYFSEREPPRKRLLGCALESVGAFLREQKQCARFAIKNLFVGRTPRPVFVLCGALERGENEVFCLNVNTSHNFYVCGVTAKNCDEEMPDELYGELMVRLQSSDGYFHMVFTATLGQDYWRRTIEPREDEEELHPTAHKQVVSLYDSARYMDGTLSPWTEEKIARAKAKCKTHAEFLKRIMGRFVVVGGRKYEAFDATRHMKAKHPVPASWFIYEGVDLGSGGESGHKAAICFVAVSPDYRSGRVFLGWRGADGIDTTAGDVFKQHLGMRHLGRANVSEEELEKAQKAKTFALNPILQTYDWSSKDFFTIASRAGEPFSPADKNHDVGEEIINTLFKNDMLAIYEDEELVKLAGELSTLMHKTPKNKAKDDFADAFRYAVTLVPWDFSYLTGADPENLSDEPKKVLDEREQEIEDRRRGYIDDEPESDHASLAEEFEEWNDAYGN